VLSALGQWQSVGGAFQLHPGDIGWQWRFGALATADAVQTWDVGGAIAAVGFRDGPTLRIAIAPASARDAGLAAAMCGDISPEVASVEAPSGSLVREDLASRGWSLGEEWVPLERDLSAAIEDCGLEVRTADSSSLEDRVAVQRASFEGSLFTAERWRAMAEGPAYASARCLVGYDEHGVAVATATVWSAGAGRPGLLEPLGVHSEYRGRGFGRAMTLAAAGALRELGSASALVGTPKANVAAVATYASAGFVPRAPVPDLDRPTS